MPPATWLLFVLTLYPIIYANKSTLFFILVPLPGLFGQVPSSVYFFFDAYLVGNNYICKYCKQTKLLEGIKYSVQGHLGGSVC